MLRMTKKVALRIAYLGDGFFGFSKQPGLRTVQSTLEDCLIRLGLMDPDGSVQSSSRTDRGVSALDNVVSFSCTGTVSLSRLNADLPEDLVAWAIASPAPDFNPRKACREKVYLYVCPELSMITPERLRSAIKLARSMGGPAFCREGSAEFPEVRLLDFSPFFRGLLFIGRHFCWEMIRRIVGFVIEYALYDHRVVRPAPPGGLVLLKTVCEGVSFTPELKWLRNFAKRWLALSSAWVGQSILISASARALDCQELISSLLSRSESL